MHLNDQDLYQIVSSTWLAMLSLDVEPDSQAEPERMSEPLTGSVQLTGHWEGAVVLHSPTSLARQVAGRLSAADPAALSLEEVRDALGEITNIVAGNLKELLAEGTHQGMPVVTEGIPSAGAGSDTRLLRRCGFRCLGEPFALLLYSR
jgi:chemotaxis protein CheX